LACLLENPSQVEIVSDQSQSQSNIAEVVSEYVFLNNEEDEEEGVSQIEVSPAISTMNGDENVKVNGQVDDGRPQNGAEAYENLVKSLTEGDGDYMKVISEDAREDENFGLIDGNILDSFSFNRDSTGLFQ
jgi:hypothetical protein